MKNIINIINFLQLFLFLNIFCSIFFVFMEKYKKMIILFAIMNNMKKSQEYYPDIFELEEIPYVLKQLYNLQVSPSEQNLHKLRSTTHRYSHVLAKIYTFWQESSKRPHAMQEDEEEEFFTLALCTEVPVMTIDELVYLLNSKYAEQQLAKQEWNIMVGQIEKFKSFCIGYIRQQLMAQYQINFRKNDFCGFNVYACEHQTYRVKAFLKGVQFQHGPSFAKKFNGTHEKQELHIKHEKVKLWINGEKEKKLMKMKNTKFSEKSLKKFWRKYENFYIKPLKNIDEKVLELQVYHNFPLLRQKGECVIKFKDRMSGEAFSGPIFSNANPLCMYGHFNGYNSDTTIQEEIQYCQDCGMKMLSFKRNFLLEYLHSNIFNFGHFSIRYRPEYNRFRLMKKVPLNGQLEKQMGFLSLQDRKNSYDEVLYCNFMHLKTSLMKMYSKNRTRLFPDEDVERVCLSYQLNDRNTTIKDPVRGKDCDHYSFADLRQYYKSRKKVVRGNMIQYVYICPICGRDVEEGDLLYLSEMLPIIKYLIQEANPSKQSFLGNMADKNNGMFILLNHKAKKVSISYVEVKDNDLDIVEKEVEDFYEKMVDPFVHFSQYRLGLRNQKREKRNNRFFFGGLGEEQSDSDFENQLTLQKDRNQR